MATRVHDANDLPLIAKPLDDLRILEHADHFQACSAQREVEGSGLVDDRPNVLQTDRESLTMFNRRLSGRTEQHRRTVVLDKFSERGQSGIKQIRRERLRLIQDDHAFRESMQLAAA
jgi:hypothetical protein